MVKEEYGHFSRVIMDFRDFRETDKSFKSRSDGYLISLISSAKNTKIDLKKNFTMEIFLFAFQTQIFSNKILIENNSIEFFFFYPNTNIQRAQNK